MIYFYVLCYFFLWLHLNSHHKTSDGYHGNEHSGLPWGCERNSAEEDSGWDEG